MTACEACVTTLKSAITPPRFGQSIRVSAVAGPSGLAASSLLVGVLSVNHAAVTVLGGLTAAPWLAASTTSATCVTA